MLLEKLYSAENWVCVCVIWVVKQTRQTSTCRFHYQWRRERAAFFSSRNPGDNDGLLVPRQNSFRTRLCCRSCLGVNVCGYFLSFGALSEHVPAMLSCHGECWNEVAPSHSLDVTLTYTLQHCLNWHEGEHIMTWSFGWTVVHHPC